MFLSSLYCVAFTLLLGSEPFAYARPKGGGGNQTGNGEDRPSGECDCVHFGSFRIDKTLFIVACVFIGTILLVGLLFCLAHFFDSVRDIFICCCGSRWERIQRKEARKNRKNQKKGIIGQQGPHQAAFVQLRQNDTWNSTKSQQAMPYGQGGLGYVHKLEKAPSTPPVKVYVPPRPPPYLQYHPSGSQDYIPPRPYSIPFTKQPNPL